MKMEYCIFICCLNKIFAKLIAMPIEFQIASSSGLSTVIDDSLCKAGEKPVAFKTCDDVIEGGDESTPKVSCNHLKSDKHQHKKIKKIDQEPLATHDNVILKYECHLVLCSKSCRIT
jgi:hypothetical protein